MLNDRCNISQAYMHTVQQCPILNGIVVDSNDTKRVYF